MSVAENTNTITSLCVGPPLSHLCVLESVAAGVFDILGGFVVALGVHVDGTGRSGGQEFLPDFLDSGGNFSDGTFLQLLDGEPEPVRQR